MKDVSTERITNAQRFHFFKKKKTIQYKSHEEIRCDGGI